MDLIFGVKPDVNAYLARFGMPAAEAPFEVIGIGSGGRLKGVAIWSNYKPDQDITLTVAADFSPKMIQFIPHVFGYAFDQLELPRISAEIDYNNFPSTRLALWLGFKLEGCKRGTMIRVYGLTRSDWDKVYAKRFATSGP